MRLLYKQATSIYRHLATLILGCVIFTNGLHGHCMYKHASTYLNAGRDYSLNISIWSKKKLLLHAISKASLSRLPMQDTHQLLYPYFKNAFPTLVIEQTDNQCTISRNNAEMVQPTRKGRSNQ